MNKIINQNTTAMILYKYLKQFEKTPNEFFKIPTGSEIKRATNLKLYQQQSALRYLINCEIIEKINPIHQQRDKDCPVIYRMIRFLNDTEE